jgi:TRAP transporter TAXI family solute receptor
VVIEAILKAYGLVPGKDFTALKASHSKEAMEMTRDKRAHAYGAMVREPNTAVLDQAVGARIISLDRDRVPAVLAEVPGYSAQIVPAGKPGAEQDTLAIGVFGILWGRNDLPDDVAYLIVKTLMEKQDELVPIHEDFTYWSPKRTAELATEVDFPFHPGAIRYLKERGIWTEEMQEHSGKALKYHEKK